MYKFKSKMGEAKRRKELGLPVRKKEFKMPQLDKQKLKKKIRENLYKYPIIPFMFYALAILILVVGMFSVIKIYK